MNITSFVIRRWQLTLVLFLLLAALGVSAFQAIPRSVDPHFPIPVTTIRVVLPGADAQTMEETVSKPIEEALQGLPDIDRIESTNRDGSATIVAGFEWGGDADQYFNDVTREVGAMRDQLPAGLTLFEFRRARTTNSAILQLALVSKGASWRRLEKYAEDITDGFSRYPGIRETRISGLPQPEVTVAINAARLAELRVPVTLVADALRQGGVETTGGAVEAGGRRFNVDAGGAYDDLDRIRALPLRSNDGAVLRLGDVAAIGWSAEEQRIITRHNGARAIFITAQQKDGEDVTRLRDQLMTDISSWNKRLPADMKLVVEFDQSRDVVKRMSDLGRDFTIAVLLVIVTLLPLGLRASGIVMISIPLSIACGLLGMYWAGFSLNQLTIAGFILSLGLLVDDSIVVVENIERHLRMGKPRITAAVEAVQEITPALLGSTGVLIFAFIPILFIPGGGGQFTRGFMWAIIFTISASLLISLTIIPFLASRILKRNPDGEGNTLLRWLMHHIERLYRPALHAALAAPRRTLTAAMALTLAAFLLVPSIGFSLFPDADVSHFRIAVQAEEGSSLATTDGVVQQVVAVLTTEPDIKIRAENIGAANPQVFYNIFDNTRYSSYAEVLAVMDEWRGAASAAMVERLRDKLDAIPGARISLTRFRNGAPVEAPVALRIEGPELGELKRLAGEVERILNAVPGARDVSNPVATDRLDLDLKLDDARAALLNIPAGLPRRAIRLAVNGEPAGVFRDEEGDDYPIVVRLPFENGRRSVDALEDIYVASRSGQPIRLAEISEPELKSVPPVISRRGLERSVTVTAQAGPGALASRITEAAIARIDRLALPEGYRVEIGGEAEAASDTFNDFGPVILVALFGIFAILVAEFGRFRETIVVFGVIPLGTFGGLVALWLSGQSLSFMAIIGFVALIGIEIKNSILLVDFTTQLRASGMGLRDAIEKAGEVRFLPVLLTSVTAVGGLLPLALFGGALYSSLAIVIIGGLISSTVLSRIVVPVMYLLASRGAEAKALTASPPPATASA